MAARGQVNYNDPTYRVAMKQLLQDVVKTAHKSRQTIWEAIADAQAGFTAANHAVGIEHVGPLPDFGNPTADPPYMPWKQGSNTAKTESAAQRQRIIAQAAAVMVAAAAGPAPPPPAAPAPPARPLPAPHRSPQPVATPGGPRLPDSGVPAGAAGGELAGAVCHQPP